MELEKGDNIKYVFFGTGPLAESAIYNLYHSGLIPQAIITKPDAIVGRDHLLTAPIIKTWAQSKSIPVYQPSTLNIIKLEEIYQKYTDLNTQIQTDIETQNDTQTQNDIEIENIKFYKYVKENQIDIAIVASYGKIIPEYILNWPLHGILNIHPSILPLYRGPSPIESQLLDGLDHIGLSIMKLDAGMDSGPVYIQKSISLNSKEASYLDKENQNSLVDDNIISSNYNCETIERQAGREGSEMIVQILPFIIGGNMLAKDQDHSKATFCKFIEKSQGDVTEYLSDFINQIQPPSPSPLPKGWGSTHQILLNKWRALNPWPGLYFFVDHKDKKLRVKINKINLEILLKYKVNNISNESPCDLLLTDLLLEVTPEGKHPMSWESFMNGYEIVNKLKSLD